MKKYRIKKTGRELSIGDYIYTKKKEVREVDEYTTVTIITETRKPLTQELLRTLKKKNLVEEVETKDLPDNILGLFKEIFGVSI